MLVLIAVHSSLSNGQEVWRCKNRQQTATDDTTTQLQNLQRPDIIRGALSVCAGLLALNVKRRVVVYLIPLAIDPLPSVIYAAAADTTERSTQQLVESKAIHQCTPWTTYHWHLSNHLTLHQNYELWTWCSAGLLVPHLPLVGR